MPTTTKFGLPGIYNTSLPTLNDQDGAALAIDVNGRVILGASTVTIGAIVGNVASGATDSGAPVKVGAVYNSAQQTFSTGQRTDLQSNVNGYLYTEETFAALAEDNTNQILALAIRPLSTPTYSWTRFQNYGANATLNIKASTGNIFSLYAYQTNAAPRFEQIHNTATTPAGSAVPIHSFLVPASGATLIDGNFFGQSGDNASSGLAFAFSTAFGIYTAGTAADGNRVVMYK